jgi:uncharacterized protein (DUF1810 family)
MDDPCNLARFVAAQQGVFSSCMTLFAQAAGESDADWDGGPAPQVRAAQRPFDTALRKYFAGEEDPLTGELLRASKTSE